MKVDLQRAIVQLCRFQSFCAHIFGPVPRIDCVNKSCIRFLCFASSGMPTRRNTPNHQLLFLEQKHTDLVIDDAQEAIEPKGLLLVLYEPQRRSGTVSGLC